MARMVAGPGSKWGRPEDRRPEQDKHGVCGSKMVVGGRRRQVAQDSRDYFSSGATKAGRNVRNNGHVSVAGGNEARESRYGGTGRQQRKGGLVGVKSLSKRTDVVISATQLGLCRCNLSRYILQEMKSSTSFLRFMQFIFLGLLSN